MAIRKRLKRKYLVYLDKSIAALLASIDRINNVHDSYKIEESLILLTNAWELFVKGFAQRMFELRPKNIARLATWNRVKKD